VPRESLLRIGELSRRVGLSPELLRAWENRYGLVRPERTAGGLRLYSQADERRVRRMQAHVEAGLSAAEAARLTALEEDTPRDASTAELANIAVALERSFDALDDGAAQAAIDQLLMVAPLPRVLAEVILPFLQRLGQRWEAGEVSVANEHFASNLIGGRLRALSEGWGGGAGPMALLACPPGEQHDLGLLSFALILREDGWRITYLGDDTPLGEVARVADSIAPDIVVLSSVTPKRFGAVADELNLLADRSPVLIGGAGASSGKARDLRAEALGDDMIAIAAELTSRHRRRIARR
jgi:DNA-binding transcriptional MerR regulator